ncbi:MULTISPECIES: hypothetical protein [unclassified Isoptericola]|uniref:hypothetical protein n=1 Tax=unclassified Isoptericola TaxID=2623355 RepID=UPI00364F94B1
MKVQIKVAPGGLYNGEPVTARVGDIVDLPDEYAHGLVRGGLAAEVIDDVDELRAALEGDHGPELQPAGDGQTAGEQETATAKDPAEQTATTGEAAAEKRPARQRAEKRG